MTGLLESRLWRDSPARSLRNKGLSIKSLFSFGLEPLPLSGGAAGWPLLLLPGVGHPFRPDQKVKLDKGEAQQRGAAPSAKHLNLETAPITSLWSRTTGLRSMDLSDGSRRFVTKKVGREIAEVGGLAASHVSKSARRGERGNHFFRVKALG